MAASLNPRKSCLLPRWRWLCATTHSAAIDAASHHLLRRATHATASPAPPPPTAVQAPQAPSSHDGSLSQQQRLQQKLQRTVKKHLERMDDPWTIAHHVQETLARDRFDEALLLTQRASRDGQVVVAWNHLIGHMLEKQKLKGAIKLYHDMKKRGQLPNVQTFTVIFRGCVKSQHPRLAVAEAVKLYNVLMADKRLTANAIHLNAVLNVCARAGDLDSMFLIANSANDSTRAPTAYTYTTILNALRHAALRDVRDLSLPERAAYLQKTVDRSNALWTEVTAKWTQGRLVIDEELVCAMGRVLLLAPNRQDKRQLFSLVHQTMNIPNFTAAAPTPADTTTTTATTITPSQPSKAFFATPGRNTLALLLTAVASARLPLAGVKYWDTLVRDHGVSPDRDNWLRMFGALKVAKASSRAASLLPVLPAEFVHATPYQIAMETCVRDNINANAVDNATAVLDSMMARLALPDLHTLRMYLRVALVSHFHLRARARDGHDDAAKLAYGLQISRALARLWEPYKSLHYHYFKATPAPAADRDRAILYNNKREVIALARLMFSASNKVLNEGMLPEKHLRELRPIGAKINREIQAFYANREQMEPKLRPLSAAGNVSTATAPSVTDTNAEAESNHRFGADFVWDTTKSRDSISHHVDRL